MLKEVPVNTLEKIINSVKVNVSRKIGDEYVLLIHGSSAKVLDQNLKRGYVIGDLDFWVIGGEEKIELVEIKSNSGEIYYVPLNQLKLWNLQRELLERFGIPIQIGYSPNLNSLDTFGKTAILYGKILDQEGNIGEEIERLKGNGIRFSEDDYKITKISLMNKINRYFGAKIINEVSEEKPFGKKEIRHLEGSLTKVVAIHVYGRDKGEFPKDINTMVSQIRRYGNIDVAMKEYKIDRDFRTLEEIRQNLGNILRKYGINEFKVVGHYYMTDVVSPSNESWRSVLVVPGYFIAGFINMNNSSEFSVINQDHTIYRVIAGLIANNLKEVSNLVFYEVIYS